MQIEQGSVVKGKVTGLTDFGAFVELEGGKTGMIHISEVSTSYVKDIREHLQLNQEVTAKPRRQDSPFDKEAQCRQ